MSSPAAAPCIIRHAHAGDVAVALHQDLGFVTVGVFRRAGFKHGQWCDTGWWQLDLGDDSAPAPPRPPAP